MPAFKHRSLTVLLTLPLLISLAACTFLDSQRPPAVVSQKPSPYLTTCAVEPVAPVPLLMCSQAISYAVDLRAANQQNCKKLEEIGRMMSTPVTQDK